MTLFSKFTENLKSVGLSKDEHSLGLIYHTSSVASVLAFINNDQKILEPLNSFIDIDLPVSEWRSKKISDKIFLQYYFNASTTNNDLEHPKSESLNKLLSSSQNEFELISKIESESNKNKRILKLFESTGRILIKHGIEAFDDVINLAYNHFNYWKYSPDGATLTSSIIMSNVLPTYLADVINTFPFPDKFQSNPKIWLFSKELDNRIKDEKYSFDLPTMQWIWNLHNSIFYVKDPNKIELQAKYSSPKGFTEMLSDLFYNINYVVPKLRSKEWEFHSKYKTKDDWAEFIKEVNNYLESDYGESWRKDYVAIGEFYSFHSYRFINAIKLFIKRKEKSRFKFW